MRLVRTIRTTSAHFTLDKAFWTHFYPFTKRRCVFLVHLCVFCRSFFVNPKPSFFFATCPHFPVDATSDDEALNLRFFFSFSFLVTLHVSFTKIAQNQSIAFCGRRDAKSTLVVRIQPPPLSARRKREGETVSLFSSTPQSPKTKTHYFVFFGVKVFSRSSSSSSSSFEEEVEKKSNGVVWLERIRLIGQRPQRVEGIVVVVDIIEKETR